MLRLLKKASAGGPPSAVTVHEQKLLEIETARVRHAWATAQVARAGATLALTNYLRESLNELSLLRANDLEIELAQNYDA